LGNVYEPDQYRKSQEYARTTTHFGLISNTFLLIVLLGFWFIGGFNFLDVGLRELDLHILVTGVLYIIIITIAHTFISLPFDIYETFVIEQRFGFNKTTPITFITDFLKGIALSAILGIPLLFGVLAFFEYAGMHAWIYCWIALTLFTLALEFVAPTWIMPLFNKFTPLESGQLRDEIMKYARTVNFKVNDVLVMDGSKRSTKANAFFTGFGRNKRIALFDTLVNNQTTSELVAVLAHEIGHYKKNHILQGIILRIFNTGLVFFLMSIALKSSGLYDTFFMDQQSIYSGLLFFALLYTPVNVVLSIGLNYVSRKHEYEADKWASETYEEPISLISALKKLSSENLSNLCPHPLLVFLSYSHPPLLNRIQAIEYNNLHKIPSDNPKEKTPTK
jgi:STE24 endopeptidase